MMRPALAVTAIGLAGLIVATRAAVGGSFVYPLDDAYIHMGVARNLAEHGTWGVNPDEFVSASSSPLWTTLLAALYALIGPSHVAPLVLNGIAALSCLDQAARWLRDEGREDPVALVVMAVAMPLPFVAALGMEHALQLATVLWLVRCSERAGWGWIAAASAIATLTRYESAFVALWLSALLLSDRRVVEAVAAAGGAALAVVGFGLFSVAQGGLFLPNSVLKKAPLSFESVVQSFQEGGVVLVLVAGAALWAGTEAPLVGRASLPARRATVFVLVALTHLCLARVGWLYRYEAWLVGWGALILAPALRERPLAALAVGAPVALRAAHAALLFPQGARFQADVDDALARWIAADWPEVTVAVHDLGAAAYRTDATLVDVGGIGTDEITRPFLDGTLTPEHVGRILEDRGAVLAITGPVWLQGDPPPRAREIGRIRAPFGDDLHDTVIWSLDDAARPRLHESFAGWTFSDRVEVVLKDGRALDVRQARIAGAAVRVEDDTLAFYTNGRADLDVPAGPLTLVVRGTPAEGRGPRFTVTLGGQQLTIDAGPDEQLVPIGSGDVLSIVYDDDLVDASGADRNLFVRVRADAP
jgi:hypothetical protein